MRSPTSAMVLLAVAALTALACTSDDPPDGAVPGPPSSSPTAEATATPTASPTPTPPAVASPNDELIPPPVICGIEVRTTQRTERERAARQCFLDAYQRGEAAQFYFTSLTREGDPVGTVFTTTAGGIDAFAISQDPGRSGQFAFACSRLEPTDDELVFTIADCTQSVAASSPDPDGSAPMQTPVLCGAEIVIHSMDHFNQQARRCFWDAFQIGAPARLFTTQFSTEGDPISEVLTVATNGSVAVYRDSRDNFGLIGRFTFACGQLIEADSPFVFTLSDCTEPAELDRLGAQRGDSPPDDKHLLVQWPTHGIDRTEG